MDILQVGLSWLSANYVVILVVCLGTVLLAVVRDWKNANEAVRDLFLLAEKALSGLVISSGPEAMEAVLESLYALLPGRLKAVLKLTATLMGKTEDELLAQWAQLVYDSIKKKYTEKLSLINNGQDRWCTFVKRKL